MQSRGTTDQELGRLLRLAGLSLEELGQFMEAVAGLTKKVDDLQKTATANSESLTAIQKSVDDQDKKLNGLVTALKSDAVSDIETLKAEVAKI